MLAYTTTDDVLSFPGPPHLERFLFSVLSVSFSFCQVDM